MPDDMKIALSSMVQGARAPMGPDPVSSVVGNLSGNASHNPDMVRAKYQMQVSDPAFGPTNRRTPVVNNSTERNGAAFSVKTNFAPLVDPSAGETQANGKIVPSSYPRSDKAFGAGIASAG